MKKIACPECGSEDFEISTTVEDTVIYRGVVFEDGTIDYREHLKTYDGESIDVKDEVECRGCGRVYSAKELAADKRQAVKDIWNED